MAEIKPTATTTAAPRTTTTTSVQPKRTKKRRFMDRSTIVYCFRVLYLAFLNWI